VTAQRYVDFGREPSGLGYIRIRSFSGHGDLTDEFDRALEALRDTRGLILDIRDNPGGFGQPHMVGRLLHKRSLASISYVKAGARHSALEKRKGYLDPSGAWQYLRPIALLVNGGTASAAELFASELRSARRVVTIGATTHGDLSGVADFAVLPCGLVVRISNGYVCDAKGRPIEVNGNTPDIAVDPTISDVLSGRDPVLDKAVHSLRADI
jgi:carboxyl-terminal processing protease